MTDLLISPALIPGESGYCLTSSIVQAWQRGMVARLWGIGPRIVSARLTKASGGGIWKALERFHDVTYDLLDECEAHGVRHPSSYSSIYHALASTPKVYATYNRMLDWWSGGPWQEALRPGVHTGTWYRYDLRSAYRWAATEGLPDIGSIEAVRVRNPTDHDGIWVAEIQPGRPDLPPCFRNGGTCVITSEEIRQFRMSARACRILRGLRWSRTMPSDYVERTISRFRCAKSIGRAYWGRWISKEPLRTTTPTSSWETPNNRLNFVWGMVIIARVRLRLWEHVTHAAHVFVDEVVIPYTLKTGDALGDWHLKETYDGLIVKRTGHYGGRNSAPAMATGIPKQRMVA